MGVTKFQDLDLADEDRDWNSDEAESRVRKWADAEDGPNEKYHQAFLWYDDDKAGNFTAHKLPYADVIGGELKAVPSAIQSAAAVIDGARGGVDLPSKDVQPVKDHLAKYYGKMGDSPPWE